jgi:23S rRNA pseudouridine1911/1915/1917 synthase
MQNPTILFEDNHLLLLNKPAGWLVQGDKTGDLTLPDWGKVYLKEKYDKHGEVFLHPVHRLDRPVSGVVLLARTSKALARLNEMFREREIGKVYWAIVQGKPTDLEGELRHFLVKDTHNNTVKAYKNPPSKALDAKEAILTYKTLQTNGKQSLLKVMPHTGRPHQIRVQLASMNCPIIGDLKYGADVALSNASIALHAYTLNFTHPVKKEAMQIHAPLPDLSIWTQFNTLKDS